jgi:hypothetical protein
MSVDGWIILLLIIFIFGFLLGYRVATSKAFAEGFSQGELKGMQRGHEKGQHDGLKAGLRAEMIQAMQKTAVNMPAADTEIEKMRAQVQQELLSALQEAKPNGGSEKTAKYQFDPTQWSIYGWLILFLLAFSLAYIFL